MEDKHRIEDEIDFKQVIKTPVRWFGLVYFLFIGVIIVAGFFYINSLGILTSNKIKAAVNQAAPFRDIDKTKGISLEGVNIEEVSKPSDELLSEGKKLFEANCVSCHGSEGKGDGPAGASLNPPVRNFHISDGWKNGRKISEIYKTLEEGISGTAMAAYEYLPVKDRFAIIHYLRTFAADFPQDNPEDLKRLNDEYSLAEGRVTSNQIPVSMAINKLSSESAESQENKKRFFSYLETNMEEEGAKLYMKLCGDYDYAAYLLSSSKEWTTNINGFKAYLFKLQEAGAFKPNVIRLNNQDLEILFEFLKISV